jgi:hypothetical protein
MSDAAKGDADRDERAKRACVLVQREDEVEVRPKGRDSALRAGIFKAGGSTDPISGFAGGVISHRLFSVIVSMSPSGYPSAWLRPRRARFCFT